MLVMTNEVENHLTSAHLNNGDPPTALPAWFNAEKMDYIGCRV